MQHRLCSRLAAHLHAGDARKLGDCAAQGLPALSVIELDQHLLVLVQAIEEEGAEWQIFTRGGHAQLTPDPLHRDLKRLRSAVGSQRDHFTVQHQATRRERATELDDLGQRLRELVSIAGIQGNALAFFVQLNACAVELVLDSGRRGARKRLGGALGRLREHWTQWPKQADGKCRELGFPSAKRGECYVSRTAREQHGFANRFAGHARGGAERIEHDALERALAQLAQNQPRHEITFFRIQASEERREQALALAGHAFAGEIFECLKHRIELEHTDFRALRLGLCAHARQGAIAQPEPPLTQLAAQEADRSGQLGHRKLTQQLGKPRYFLGS